MNGIAKIFILFAAMNGFLVVCLGAFGSHGLKAKLAANLLSAWQTGVQYHFYHVLALFGVGLLVERGYGSGLTTASGVLFALGMLLFCGSLYWLALGGPRWLGPVTPVGGLCFISGWFLLFIAVWRT